MNESHITRYDVMPIPPVDEQTLWFDAGVLRIGVEYRLLNDAIAAASALEAATGDSKGVAGVEDRGVSIHVFGSAGGESLELLRFDCFEEDPHYHYISWHDKKNEMVHLDPIADGDPLAWTLERLRLRLPHMLERAGAPGVAEQVDQRAVDAVLPRLAEAAYRARYEHDDDTLLKGALRD
ncbi:MAG: hypothetical protein HRU01_19345 [Myxococcales bacterium]|nr:hypothetical protein [Myxococcales bacterium]